MGNHSMKNCWVMKVLRAITFIAAVLPWYVLSEEQSCSCKALSLCRGSKSVTRKLPAGLDESTIQSALDSAHVNQHTSSSLATGASQGHHYHSHMRNVDKDLHEIAEKLRGLSSLDSTIGNVVGNEVIGIDATNSDAIRSTCPWLNDRKPVCTSPGPGSREYRTVNGECNNKANPIYGKQDTPFQRLLEPSYSNGFKPRKSEQGTDLPSARLITTGAFQTGEDTNCKISELFTQFGQFVDHDLVHATLTPDLTCCDKNEKGKPWKFPDDLSSKDERCFPIKIQSTDCHWGSVGRRCLDFSRNLISPTLQCAVGAHEQTNALTHWLDLSNTYGNTQEEAAAVRDGNTQYLLTSKINGGSTIPPTCPKKAEPEIEACGEFCRDEKLQCVFSGDLRINEQPGLTLVHLQWIRNHNRLASKLTELNPSWTEEKLFQEARRINIAMFQHVLYKEWLPIALGRQYMEDLNLLPRESGHTMDYDPTLDPRVTNEFSAAAFRFGHSMVKSTLTRKSGGNQLLSVSKLRDSFFNMTVLREDGFIENIIRGNTRESAANVDGQFAEDLTNFLFANIQNTTEMGGLDLMSFNIQRGRDRGVQGYNRYRKVCECGSFKQVASFDELSGQGGFHSPENVRKLKSLYEDVNDIDLFVGGILENPDTDALLGPTFKCIIGDQFVRLKRGDRFWFENKHDNGFTEAQLTEIRKFSQARLLCNNNFNIDQIQPNPFLTNNGGDNSLKSCDHFSEIDLGVFKDLPSVYELLIGGHSNVMDLWTPSNQECDRKPFGHLPERVGPASRAAKLGEQIFNCGGHLSSQLGGTPKCYATNWKGGCWSRAEDMNVARIAHTLTTVGDTLVVAGGHGGAAGGITASVEIRTEHSCWKVANWTLEKPVQRHCAIAISDSELMVISGQSSSKMMITKYNIFSGAREHVEPPSENVTHAAFSCIRSNINPDIVYVSDNVNWQQTRNMVWKYDIKRNSW